MRCGVPHKLKGIQGAYKYVSGGILRSRSSPSRLLDIRSSADSSSETHSTQFGFVNSQRYRVPDSLTPSGSAESQRFFTSEGITHRHMGRGTLRESELLMGAVLQ